MLLALVMLTIMLTGLVFMMTISCNYFPVLFMPMMTMVMMCHVVPGTDLYANMCADFRLSINKGSTKKHSGNSGNQQNVFFIIILLFSQLFNGEKKVLISMF